MPKRKRSRSGAPRVLLILAIAAVALFAAGESWYLLRSDSGRLALGRLGFGDRAELTRIVGGHARQALAAAGVRRDSIRESVLERGPAGVRWRVGLAPGASALQAHYALAELLGRAGARVLSGRERPLAGGGLEVTLLAGVGARATHEIVLVSPARTTEAPGAAGGRMALVLYGFADDDSLARACMAIEAPFAVAIVPAGKTSRTQLALARAAAREVVLHLPLEPVNYPQVNPGPGAILVTMTPSQIMSRVGRFVDQSRPVVAVANHMGSLATQDMTVMSAIYRELKQRHLPFLHVQPAPGAVCRSLASNLGVAYDEPDAVLDAEARAADPRVLEKRWNELLERARDRGHLIVWVRATPALARALPRLADPKQLHGVDLVALSSLLRRPLAL